MSALEITYNSKAIRISKQMAQDLRTGHYRPGALLPSENELAGRYNVSRTTLRRALAILDEQGLLHKHKGRGIVVPVAPTVKGSDPDRDAMALDLHPVGSAAELTIAVLLSGPPNAHKHRLQEGINRYAKQAGLKFQMISFVQDYEKALAGVRHLSAYSIQGAIVYPVAEDGFISAVQDLIQKQFPLICVDRVIGGIHASLVEVDNAAGTYGATQHMIEKHHRPACFVSLPLENTTIHRRFEGYRHAMIDAGYEDLIGDLTFFSDIVEHDREFWKPAQTWLPGFKAAMRCFEKVSPPLSVVCLNDVAAQGVYKAARDRGLVVGKDVTVTGFDDLPMTKLMDPPLTTVRQPSDQLGYQAAKLLHGIMRSKRQEPVQIRLPVELIIRESS